MIPITSLVQSTTYDMTPSSLRLPPFLWRAFTTLNKVHGLWRLFRRAEVYTNPDNLAHLLAGHTLNVLVGDIVVLRIAAQCLLISTRLLECVQQQSILCNKGTAWKEAVMGRYPKPIYSDWKKSTFMGSCDNHLQALGNRVQRIASHTLSLFVQTFRFSMCIIDTIDAFCLSPYTRSEALNESFVNAMKWMDAIVENKDDLLSGIIENQSIIERILQDSSFNYEQLRDGVKKTLERAEIIHAKARSISTYGNGMIITIGKRAIDEVMVTLGIAHLRPTWLAVYNP